MKKRKILSLIIPVTHLTDLQQIKLFHALFDFAHNKLPDSKTLEVIPILKTAPNQDKVKHG